MKKNTSGMQKPILLSCSYTDNETSNMNLCEDLDHYDDQYIYFCEPIKNNIINDGNFIRILYSKPFVILNGIYLCFSLHVTHVEKYYNKLKCSFSVAEHGDIVEKCKAMEDGILKKINLNKTAQYKIYEQFKNGNIKIFNDSVDHFNPGYEKKEKVEVVANQHKLSLDEWGGLNYFVLKISGIWENEFHYGLTFKFIRLRSTVKT